MSNQYRDYNSRLLPVEDKGLCGDPETVDNDEEMQRKMDQLLTLVRNSKHTVIFTGAGISTSCGIPDFCGPNGVWTKELLAKDKSNSSNKVDKSGTSRKKLRYSTVTHSSEGNSFNQAIPSFTHYSTAALTSCGIFNHVISQNVDGLHLRSGLLPSQLSELHGNIFMEKCDKCGCEFFRDHDVGGMGLRLTGNLCTNVVLRSYSKSMRGRKRKIFDTGVLSTSIPDTTQNKIIESDVCGGPLRDCAIDWDSPLPTDIFDKAHEEVDKADLLICLGTSLRIRPAGNMPLRFLRRTESRQNSVGKLVIVNLQETHLDKKADLKINNYCDNVLRLLCQLLGVDIDINGGIVSDTTNYFEEYTSNSTHVNNNNFFFDSIPNGCSWKLLPGSTALDMITRRFSEGSDFFDDPNQFLSVIK